MKTITSFCIALVMLTTFMYPVACHASGTDLQSYQNYNHGYCPGCDKAPCEPCEFYNQCEDCCEPPPPCDPCAPVCEPCAPVCEPCAPCEEPVCAPCDPCNPCDPCAPVCGTKCGISICAIGVAVAAAAAAAAILITSGSGTSSH